MIRNQPISRAAMHLYLVRKVCGSNLWPVKSDTVLPTKGLRCPPGAMTQNEHSLVLYSKYNEGF